MQYYEAYDEALDEDYGDAYDDAFDDAYDDAFDDAFDESEGEDFGEARGRNRRRRGRRPPQRRQPRRGRNQTNLSVAVKPAKTGEVKSAFNNVSQDLTKINRDLQREKARQANQQVNELIALFLFRPRLIPTVVDVDVVTKDGKPYLAGTSATDPKATTGLKVPTTTYVLEDNLIPLLAVKVLSNMKGLDSSKGFQRYLPLLAGVLLSPSAQKDLGIGDGKATNIGGLNDLTNKPLVLVLLLLLVINWSKLSNK